MPFNGSGTFSVVNTFIPNTTILSAAINQNFTDIASGLSDCLTRDGQAGMTAVFKAISGSSSAPSISFTSDTKTGTYLPATGVLGLVANALGIKINSEVFAVASAVVSAGGSGYAVGDTITETGGTFITPTVYTVATLSGSAVATVTVTVPGIYTVKPSSPVSQGSTSGSGTGATFTPTWNDPTSSDYKLGITDLSDAALWTKLGASSFVASILGKANGLDIFKSLITVGGNLFYSGSTLVGGAPKGYIDGLTLSQGSTTTLGIAAGVCRDDSNSFDITLASAYTKSTSSWAVGTGNGGLDTGAIASSTWYYTYAIYRPDSGVSDILFTATYGSPTMPANYTKKRYIGAFKTDSSSHVPVILQYGDEFYLQTPVLDINNATPGSSANTGTLASVPTGLKVKALLTATSSSGNVLYVSSLDTADLAPSTSVAPLFNVGSAIGGAGVSGQAAQDIEIWTNTSAQIRYRGGGSLAAIVTRGYRDMRGKNA